MDTNTDNKLRLFTRGQGKRLKLRGLRRRWLASSVGPIIVILVLVGVLSAATISSSLDARARSSLEAKAKSGSDYFSAYSMGSYSEYYRRAAQYVTDYSMNDSLAKNVELQFINGKRQVELSSRGAVAGSTPATPEVGRAVETGKTASFSGRDPLTGESILAVSSPVFYNGTVVAVMRFVTSTRLLDQQLWLTVLVMAAVIAAVIFLIFVSNLIFINNVVQPVAEVSEAAKRISSGSYGIQIANKYTDELGQLVDNINNMSLKISQSEKMQTEFISSVSHELRTPLTAISGWGETLLGDETGDPRQLRRGLRIIVKEARRLTGMVEELLEFSKMQDGRFTLQVEEMDLQAELDSYIGLQTVKEEVHNLINMASVYQLRRQHDLPTTDMSLHLVFTGNPGTGKTMMARMMARIYRSLDILSRGQLVEVDRSGLVAGYVGQTAIKTQKVIEKAMGGVLFIDEAYALNGRSENDFGQEAIDTILKAMEDHRDDLVVIVAGYTDLMDRFIHSNPGLESRFNRFLLFDDYTTDEMVEIFRMQCKKGCYQLTEEAQPLIRGYIAEESADDSFGNARGVRNLFEHVLVAQNNRLATMEKITREDLMTITADDVLRARGKVD